ncbi:MAG: pseudouridine synthase [Thiobacillaceae bacterium]|jgi:tRNA pseudouridine65 synthase|nr:pseudouridine synthase [Thiobacillaceae bacterium]
MRVLYLDEHLLAVDKPAGMLVHRTGIDRQETRFALQRARDLVGRRVYPAHRLDKPTAGVLLFALDADTARRLAALFAAGGVTKRYLAVARGHLPDAGVIDHPLAEAADAYDDERADQPSAAARAARTEYRCLGRAELPQAVGAHATARYSLVEATPLTGRRHQIRRHLKHVSHPVVGDTTHGDGRHNRLFRDRFGCRRLLLAAVALDLVHPVTGRRLAIRAPLDDGFREVLAALGWADLAGDAA